MLKVFRFSFIIFAIELWQINAQINELNSTQKTDFILESSVKLTDKRNPSIGVSPPHEPSPRCTQMQCKIVCFDGNAFNIEKDINRLLIHSHIDCPILNEVRIYKYAFPNSVIPKNFLQNLRRRIESIHIASSYVLDIESGAFGNGIYQYINFDDLHLRELRKDFFVNITNDFQSLIVEQTNPPITSVRREFLDHVASQIKTLTLRIGITCIRNLTDSNILLSNLQNIDFGNNDFGSSLRADTFSMVSMLERLDLSNSKIDYLPKYIFSNFASTLTFLDISYNNLKTISSEIFGWHKLRNDFEMIANNNYWLCDCKLHYEMRALYVQQRPPSKVYCAAPIEYYNWSVFDERLCENETDTTTTRTTTTPSEGMAMATNALSTPYNPSGIDITTIVDDNSMEYSEIESVHPATVCSGINLLKNQSSSSSDFTIAYRNKLRVDVQLKEEAKYDIIWFSRTTKDVYHMETNYKEYGLGCYGNISYRTTVNDLLPNASYTFCLVQKNHSKISPFNCKSIYIPENRRVPYAWLKNDSRSTGVSLIILGLVICTFVGILISFLILKNKPILLKGSKRVATTKGSVDEIVVLPKGRSLEELRIKEEMLALQFSQRYNSSVLKRRDSTESDISYQSYINPNVYEELPVYIDIDSDSFSTSLNDSNFYCLPPTPPPPPPLPPLPMPLSQQQLSTASSAVNLVQYAEIPYSHHKRSSNDPLPELPNIEFDTSSLQLKAYGILKHNFEWSNGYAFAYDCDV